MAPGKKDNIDTQGRDEGLREGNKRDLSGADILQAQREWAEGKADRNESRQGKPDNKGDDENDRMDVDEPRANGRGKGSTEDGTSKKSKVKLTMDDLDQVRF
jgi:hypothetical protein